MKIMRNASIALCLLLLALPSLGMPFFRSDGTVENRCLADYPEITGESGLNADFDTEFEDWLRDHFGFRRLAVEADALLNYRLLRTAPGDCVVAGSDGWLYFTETVPDYTGEGRLSGDELATITENLRSLAEALDERGAQLYIAVIPNKNTLYPAHMPGRYAMRRDDGNIELLRESLAVKGFGEALPVHWIDLLNPLREAGRGEALLYYKTDTHWNALGAAIAARTVLEAMGQAKPEYTRGDDALFSGGDLARLMGLTGMLSETVPTAVPAHPLPEADYAEHRLSVPGNGENRLLVYRDSFGTAIGPWLAEAWAATELRWEYPLDASADCDDALILLCERNLREYLLPSPIIEEDTDGGRYTHGIDFDDYGDDEEEDDDADYGRHRPGIDFDDYEDEGDDYDSGHRPGIDFDDYEDEGSDGTDADMREEDDGI